MAIFDQRLMDITSVVDTKRRYARVTTTQSRTIANAQDLGKELAAVLGFDGQMVRSIDLHVAVGEIVTSKVEVYVNVDQAAEIRDIFAKRVKLESKVVGEEVL